MSADEKNALSDPEKLPDSKLRAIISEVGIKLPSGYQTRAYLVSVFNANKEIILAHFSHKQNHRRKSDTSIVIPDGVPVDPYVEPGPDLMATPQRQTRLTATKRPAPVSTQEPKVEKKKAKKANPFQSKSEKPKANQAEPPLHPLQQQQQVQMQVDATPTAVIRDSSDIARYGPAFPKSLVPGYDPMNVDQNREAMQQHVTRTPYDTIAFPRLPQTPVPSSARIQQQQQQYYQSPHPSSSTQTITTAARTVPTTSTYGNSCYCCTPYTQRMPTSFPTRPIELSPFPATPAPAPAPIMAATATTTTTTAMQPGVTPFNGYTQGVAGDVSLFPPYPQSVAKTDMAFPPSRADPTAVITTAATAAMTPTATSFTSNALPDNLIFASKAQQQQQQQQTLLQPSYSEPPPLVSGPSLSTLNYNNNNNNNNNNSNSTDTKDSKDKKPAKKGFATYELVCLCAVLVGVLMLLLFPTSSEPRLPFCDTSELFGNNCQPCPEGAHCTKGVARCARGHSLVDNTLCLNREMKAQYNLVKCVHDQLAQQNYRKMCGEAKTPCLTLGELTSACDSPSNESTREALIAFGKDRGIKRCSSCSDYHYHYHYNYNYNYEYVECYSTDDVSVSYLSMCFMRENIGGVLITAVGVCLFCLFAYFLATTRRDMRKAREMHARAVKLLEEARASARRGGYSNDGFLSTTSLRSAVVPAGKHHKSKAVQAQWKIAVRMLEKDPRVTKTSVFSNGKNVNGFKMKC